MLCIPQSRVPRRLWTVPGGDEARMRFLTDTLGVKLVTRQLPLESRSFLRALLTARGRPPPASWTSPPRTANGAVSSATHAEVISLDSDDSDVPLTRPGSTPQKAAIPPVCANGCADDSSAAPGMSGREEFCVDKPAWQCMPSDGLSNLGVQQTSAPEQQQLQQQRASAEAGMPRTEISGVAQNHMRSEVASDGQTSGIQPLQPSVAPAMTFEALQGLFDKVSSVLQGAAPDQDIAQPQTVSHEAGMPPGL